MHLPFDGPIYLTVTKGPSDKGTCTVGQEAKFMFMADGSHESMVSVIIKERQLVNSLSGMTKFSLELVEKDGNWNKEFDTSISCFFDPYTDTGILIAQPR